MARESALCRAAEVKAIEIRTSLPVLLNDEWRSLGRVEELGQHAGDLLRSFAEDCARMKAEGEKSDIAGRFFYEMTTLMKRMEVIGEMEDSPGEIARLHTSTLSTRLKLDAATTARVRQQIERDFSRLREEKLSRSQRPETGRNEWYLRRHTALDEATQRIEAIIPAAQREQDAVGQSLHLGTGLVTEFKAGSDGIERAYRRFDLPGIDWQY